MDPANLWPRKFLKPILPLRLTYYPSAAALDDLLRQPRKSNEYIGFFFCEHDFTNSVSARTILGCLIRQCLSVETLSESVQRQIEQLSKRTYPDVEELEEILQSVVEHSCAVTFVVDGLNECLKSDRDIVLGILSRVMSSSQSRVKAFLSSREGLILDLSTKFDAWHHVTMHCPEAQADVTTYVEGIIKDKIESKDLAIGNDHLVQEVKSALIRGANGM